MFKGITTKEHSTVGDKKVGRDVRSTLLCREFANLS